MVTTKDVDSIDFLNVWFQSRPGDPGAPGMHGILSGFD